MELTPEEQERKQVIQRFLEGGRVVDIYRENNRSKTWFKKWLNRYQTGQKNWYKDLQREPPVIHNKSKDKIEQVVVKIRKSLMDGTEDSTRYSFVGDEAIRFRMEGLGYEPSEI
ncbi:MAG: helix-turn-helix domain-containing protein, partial [Methanoregula sp.]|nr:helix-turn-helix domain-containing protein [Methanoregula sp.]